MSGTSHRGVALAVLFGILMVAGGLLPGRPDGVRAAEYTMATAATYDVAPDDRQVSVSVKVTFENTTPDPAGQFSLFEVVDLALQEGASAITAGDADGSLTVDTAQKDGFVVATVHPRQGVRYEEQAVFTLEYELDDGAAPNLRIRPSIVAFPVWSFGTSGSVRVTLPDRYEVSVDGNELSAERADGMVTLTSGEIEDPTAWLARLQAIGPSSYQTRTRAVPLTGATVDLQVRAWTDDGAWAEATLNLVASALPLLEERIGLPYPAVGPLEVVESVATSGERDDEPLGTGTQLEAGYDQPSFVMVHQLAHIWYSGQLAADRWIREGFASLAAAEVAGTLDVEASYDPAARREQLADAAFPLISWGAGDSSEAQDAWAYASAWDVAARVAAEVGSDSLQRAWQRIAADIGPYEPVADDAPALNNATVPVVAADSRRLLDQLEAVSGADVAAIFAASVFDPDSSALLPERAAARQDFDALVGAADGWGAPDPVTLDMAAWRFDSATERIDEARDWLDDRDALMADAESVGLIVPQRLRDRYQTFGGSADARDELEAERAVVDAYVVALERSNQEPNVVEQLGLLGGPQPADLLADASQLFSEGELRGAAEASAAAQLRLDHALTDGIVRLLAILLVVVVVGLVAYRLARRGRGGSGTDYTAAP